MSSKPIDVDPKEAETVTEVSNESSKTVPHLYSDAEMQKVTQLVARGIPFKDAKVLVSAMNEAFGESWKAEELDVNPYMLMTASYYWVIVRHEIEMLRRDIQKWHDKLDASIARERSLLDLDGSLFGQARRNLDELANQSTDTTDPIKKRWKFCINGGSSKP